MRRARALLARLHESELAGVYECRRAMLQHRTPGPDATFLLLRLASLHPSECRDDIERNYVTWARRSLLCPLRKVNPSPGKDPHR